MNQNLKIAVVVVVAFLIYRKLTAKKVASKYGMSDAPRGVIASAPAQNFDFDW